MPEDWTEVSSPGERVRTIAESMQRSHTAEWVAGQAEVDEDAARDVLEEMVDDGKLITWTAERGDRYAVNEGRALVEYLREIGEETEDGILISSEVVEELEMGRPDTSGDDMSVTEMLLNARERDKQRMRDKYGLNDDPD